MMCRNSALSGSRSEISSQTLQGVGQRPNGSAKILQRGLTAIDALKGEGKRVRKAAYRRIGRHGSEKRLCLHELSGDTLHVLDRSEEQSVVGPEWSRVRSLNRVEQVPLGAQTLGEPSGSLLAQF